MTNAGLLSWVKSRVRGSADFRSERGASIQSRVASASQGTPTAASQGASTNSSRHHRRQQQRPQPPIPRQHRGDSDSRFANHSSPSPSHQSSVVIADQADPIDCSTPTSPTSSHIYEEISCCIRGCGDAGHLDSPARELGQRRVRHGSLSSRGQPRVMDHLVFEEAKQFGRFLIVPMKRRADGIAEEEIQGEEHNNNHHHHHQYAKGTPNHDRTVSTMSSCGDSVSEVVTSRSADHHHQHHLLVDTPRQELRNGAVYRQRSAYSSTRSSVNHQFTRDTADESTTSGNRLQSPVADITSPSLSYSTSSSSCYRYRSSSTPLDASHHRRVPTGYAVGTTYTGECSPCTEDSGFSSADQWSPRPLVKNQSAAGLGVPLDRQYSTESVPSDSYVRVLNSSMYGCVSPVPGTPTAHLPPSQDNDRATTTTTTATATATKHNLHRNVVPTDLRGFNNTSSSTTALRVPTPTTTSILYGQTTAPPDVKGHRVCDGLDGEARRRVDEVNKISEEVLSHSTPIRELVTPLGYQATPIRDLDTPIRDLATPTRDLDSPIRDLSTPTPSRPMPICTTPTGEFQETRPMVTPLFVATAPAPSALVTSLTPSSSSAFCPAKPIRKSLESSACSVYPSSSPDTSLITSSSSSLSSECSSLPTEVCGDVITTCEVGVSSETTGFLTHTQAKSLSFVERLSCSSHAWPRLNQNHQNNTSIGARTSGVSMNTNVMIRESGRIEVVL